MLAGVKRESADGYARALATDGDWRVIRCRNDLQWIIQRRVNSGPEPWRNRWYCATFAGLRRHIRDGASICTITGKSYSDGYTVSRRLARWVGDLETECGAESVRGSRSASPCSTGITGTENALHAPEIGVSGHMRDTAPFPPPMPNLNI